MRKKLQRYTSPIIYETTTNASTHKKMALIIVQMQIHRDSRVWVEKFMNLRERKLCAIGRPTWDYYMMPTQVSIKYPKPPMGKLQGYVCLCSPTIGRQYHYIREHIYSQFYRVNSNVHKKPGAGKPDPKHQNSHKWCSSLCASTAYKI